MDPYIIEWLNLLVRWGHMIAGVAWIGASFYFNWLENNLDRRNPINGVSGELWAIHGGGIYHTLLAIVYYLNAQLYLVAPGSGISSTAAIAISIGSLIAGWFIYSLLCDSALGKKPTLLAALIFILLVGAAWALSQVFNGRAAYIHVGAIIGTIMVGNVFRVIMPAQRALVGAIEAGHC